MEEPETTIHTQKASPTKTVLFIVLILLTLALIGWALHRLNHLNDISGGNSPAPQQHTDANPDPVKSDTGSTGDTDTSPSGTGPGSDNSIVGPP